MSYAAVRVSDDASPGAPTPELAANAESGGAEDRGDEQPSEDALDTTVPAAPEHYAVRVSHPWLERDAEIDGLLHAAGFNQAQAQLVYDLAAEVVVPVIAGMAAEYEKKMAQGRLEAHFGGPERFAAIARQVKGGASGIFRRPYSRRSRPRPTGSRRCIT